MNYNKIKIAPSIIGCIALTTTIHLQAAELWIGAAQANITPDRSISLSGQFHNRIASTILSPCTANVLALESWENGKPVDCAILVSMDVVNLRDTQEEFRWSVRSRQSRLCLGS